MLELLTAQMVAAAATALAELVRRRRNRTVSMTFSDGRQMLVQPDDVLALAARGDALNPSELPLGASEYLTADELAELTAAARNAIVLLHASHHGRVGSPRELVAPEVSPAMIDAYKEILADEFVWIPSADLSLTAEYFAMRDSGLPISAEAVEWRELAEDAALLEKLVVPPLQEFSSVADT